jgi:hypothetical protein
VDANFNAHVRDFRVSHHKLCGTTLEAKTLFYMALEVPYTGKTTKEYDVHSFCILVLEVTCRLDM